MGGDDSQKLLPRREYYSSPGRIRLPVRGKIQGPSAPVRDHSTPALLGLAIEGVELTIFLAAPRGPQ